FALRGREVPITIYGPPGLRELFDALRRIFGKLTYTVELKELRPGDELLREDYRLVTFAVAHGVSAVGYALVEDTRPGRVDVQAAGVARAAEVQLLALMHRSKRYFGGEVAREAKTIFPNTVVPRDFDTIDVRFQERGGPLLVKGGALQRRAERETVPTGEEATE